ADVLKHLNPQWLLFAVRLFLCPRWRKLSPNLGLCRNADGRLRGPIGSQCAKDRFHPAFGGFREIHVAVLAWHQALRTKAGKAFIELGAGDAKLFVAAVAKGQYGILEAL